MVAQPTQNTATRKADELGLVAAAKKEQAEQHVASIPLPHTPPVHRDMLHPMRGTTQNGPVAHSTSVRRARGTPVRTLVAAVLRWTVSNHEVTDDREQEQQEEREYAALAKALTKTNRQEDSEDNVDDRNEVEQGHPG